ncbi:hypothetical protein [uncultured Sphingopyxis sp.]|jgi:hypothetical protein|uniref:hypothetical protein n=1 Tax=uncultured Sphingopyxis sp. TaxID=310581 RepID=UPI000B2C1673|nr:hypothetical protein [uncultured Sphingopyxis sp.]
MLDRPDCPFILDVLDSLKRRGKALKHRNATPMIERFVEHRDGEAEERVEITFRARKRQTLALTIWCDRWVSIRASESISQAGWKFQYTHSGRFLGAEGSRDLIAAAESSLSAMYDLDDVSIPLDIIWRPLLANGPRAF